MSAVRERKTLFMKAFLFEKIERFVAKLCSGPESIHPAVANATIPSVLLNFVAATGRAIAGG
jgi:hypothetical protein